MHFREFMQMLAEETEKHKAYLQGSMNEGGTDRTATSSVPVASEVLRDTGGIVCRLYLTPDGALTNEERGTCLTFIFRPETRQAGA